MNILVIGDNRDMRRLLVEMLRSAFEESIVLEAPDADGGFAQCRLCRPDVVLIDVGLPDANGVELTRVITALLPSVTLLVVSRFRSRAYIDAVVAAGATACLEMEDVCELLVPPSSVTLAPAHAPGGVRTWQGAPA